MKIVSYRTNEEDGWGVIDQENIIPMSSIWSDSRAALMDGIDAIAIECIKIKTRIPFSSIENWYPPIREPKKILCVGVNYSLHAIEAGRSESSKPSFFIRYSDSFVGQGEPVERPKDSHELDYEAELAVVIGVGGRYIDSKNAFDHVAGYMCMAENSVRDFQKHSTQVTAGKNFLRSGAVGPWIVTKDEVEDISSLQITGQLNGATVQSASISEMVFTIPELISYASTFTQLNPGDVIATGTPSGVGFKKVPPIYLKPGDIFEVNISGIGCLRNGVIDESWR